MSQLGIVRLLIRRCLNSEEGETILFPIESAKSQESMRVMLLQERRKMAEIDPNISYKVRITKVEMGGKFFVQLYRASDPSMNITVIDKEGKAHTERLTPPANPVIVSRILEMIESGITPDDITKGQYFASGMFTDDDVFRALDEVKRHLTAQDKL